MPLHHHLRDPRAQRIAHAIIRRYDARLHGAEHVPASGPALLVGNHTLFGLDAFPLTALLATHVGRIPRFLGERNLWRIPVFRRALDWVGAIPGVADDAVRLLDAGELVMVYPGGVDDSFKPTRDAYKLQWGDRAGFARVAMRARAPIVPIAATGIDELFEVHTRERWFGRTLLGSPRYDLPIPRNLRPRRVPLDYLVLAAIETHGAVDDPAAVERVRGATYDALDAVLAKFREGGVSRTRG